MRPRAAGKPVVVHFLGADAGRDVRAPGLVVADFVAARRRRRRGARPRRAAAADVGAAADVRDRRRRQLRGRDGADADGGSRPVHRRHVLLRGATRVHRPRPAVPFQRAGRRRVAARRPARRPRLPRPGRRRLHARTPASDDRPVAARRGGAHAGRRDPATAAILFDVVLGFGSHDEPGRAGSRRRWPPRSARRARTAARWR